MIKVLFIILILYVVYKLVKGGVIAVNLPPPPATAPPPPVPGTTASLGSRILAALKSVF